MMPAFFSSHHICVMTCGGKTPAAIPILGRRSEFVVEGHSVKILGLILLHHR